ncbi:magnesium chelatase domain-containing protein [Nocardia sp. NPDC004068]|uniref:magnesium chelatase domain-containing protein n=1 Tax=Nocardia sp. NPDC004068 TaxID=3364303 RepID=UPI0036B4F97C
MTAHAIGPNGPITVQVTIASNQGATASTTGITAESRDRVRAALLNSGEPYPAGAVQISCDSPGRVRAGSAVDLAVAVAIVAAVDASVREGLEDTLLLGELGLDGSLRQIEGTAVAIASDAAGFARLVVPYPGDVSVDGRQVLAAASLGEVLAWLRGSGRLFDVSMKCMVPIERPDNLPGGRSATASESHVEAHRKALSRSRCRGQQGTASENSG